MNRRNLIKTLLGLLAFPNIVKGEALRSMNDKEHGVDRLHYRGDNPEAATKYISSLYRSKAFAFQELDGKIRSVKDIHGNEANYAANTFRHYTISGEGKTREEAWGRFWGDFTKQTTNPNYDATYQEIKNKREKDIFWRREVVEGKGYLNTADSDVNALKTNYYVSCRFSLGKFV